MLRVETPASASLGHARGGDEGPIETTVHSRHREGGDGQRLDPGVEGLVEVAELLVVREVPRTRPVAQRDDEPGAIRITADPGCGLDVLGGVLGLADDEHEAEPGDVDAHLEHGGRQDHVVGVGRRLPALDALPCAGRRHRRCLGSGGVDFRVEAEGHAVQGGGDVR